MKENLTTLSIAEANKVIGDMLNCYEHGSNVRFDLAFAESLESVSTSAWRTNDQEIKGAWKRPSDLELLFEMTIPR